MAIIIGTANIQNNPDLTHGNVVRCGELIGSKKPDFVGFQELVEKEDHRDILTGMGHQYLLTDNSQCAIAYDVSKWTLVSRSREMGTYGVESITPDLPIVIATFKRHLRQYVTVINTHMVPLTLHGKKRDRYLERLDMWNFHSNRLNTVIASQKYPTFVTGDFNNIIFPFNLGHCLINNGLDRIYGNGNGKFIEVLQKFSIRNPSDHDAQLVKVRIK